MKSLICLSGKRNSGKTTAERFILNQLENMAVSYQMATLLKDIICRLTGCSKSDLDNQDFKKLFSFYTVDNQNLTYRELLIHLGRVFRKDNNDIFINDVLNFLKGCNKPCVIIPDVREVREINILKQYCDNNDIKFISIRINRPDSVIEDNLSNDKTETDLDTYVFDYCICNDSDINDLYAKLYDILIDNDITFKTYYQQQLSF